MDMETLIVTLEELLEV